MNNKSVLITGFKPYRDFSPNPTEVVIKYFLEHERMGLKVTTSSLSVSFRKSGDKITELIKKNKPHICLCLGLRSAGIPCISFEKIAINLDNAPQSDNEGYHPKYDLIALEGPVAYWSGLPVHKIVQEICKKGIPATVSCSPGANVCNHVFYKAVHYVKTNKLHTKVGFVHIPQLPFLVAQNPELIAMPSMNLDDITRAIEIALSVSINEFTEEQEGKVL